ncbi:hypothetical protein BY996DRAFT_7237194 [Phakopsora pachyrhizi]|nr:hypothetical protein BY996DRAFT_7237194 [Phakopsora pachyrhizi]
MAKSLRSKSKRAFRAKKRTSEKSDYCITETRRLQRLSENLQRNLDKQKDDEQKDKDGDQEMKAEGSKEEVSSPKVSTHGPRMSGREVWKASKKGVQLRRAPSTTVWHQRSSCKPQRRR